MSSFLFQVSLNGYEWRDLLDAKPERSSHSKRYLVPQHAGDPGDFPVRVYDPSDEPALFRNFADLEDSETAIKSFADRYGPLGGPVSKTVGIPVGSSTTKELVDLGETRDDWSQAVLELQHAIRFWDLAQDRNTTELAKHVVWKGSEEDEEYSVGFFGKAQAPSTKRTSLQGGYWLIAHSTIGGGEINRFAYGDVIGPTVLHVQSFANEKLKMSAQPYLVSGPNKLRPRVELKPIGLLGALWVQFARSIENDRHFRRCEHCDTWFQYEPGRGRYPRKFCSQAHKVASHRLAKKVAELERGGSSAQGIAKRLSVPVKRVRQLLSQ